MGPVQDTDLWSSSEDLLGDPAAATRRASEPGLGDLPLGVHLLSLVGPGGEVLYENPAARRMFGPCVGLSLAEEVLPELARELALDVVLEAQGL